MKLIRDLGPLAVAVALSGAVIGFLLSRDNSLGNWLLAAFLLGHGLVHAMYLVPSKVARPAAAGTVSWPFDLSRSWLAFGSGSNAAVLRGPGVVLVGVTVVCFALAALASVPLVLPASLWAGLILTAACASAALIAVFFSPELLVGLAIDAVLLYVALLRVWVPG